MEEELLKKWDIHRIIQEAIRTSHSEPSPETKARLKSLEDNQKKFMEKMDNLEEKIDKVLLRVTSLPKEIFDEADKKYASKLVEKIIYAISGAVGLTIVYAIIELVIKR